LALVRIGLAIGPGRLDAPSLVILLEAKVSGCRALSGDLVWNGILDPRLRLRARSRTGGAGEAEQTDGQQTDYRALRIATVSINPSDHHAILKKQTGCRSRKLED
jgi:hypothetical protein